MPPTRGHDLKLDMHKMTQEKWQDAPHTGARLETQNFYWPWMLATDAPHTGARLETLYNFRHP